ncbi:MAG: hypothetical protein KME26_32905 [Oscillatoria princeps RMCB-10]|nr:hypothetical protein [Oscillatoria princeps RMCB-10]
MLRNQVSLSPRRCRCRRQKPGFWNNLCISPEICAQKPGFFIPAPVPVPVPKAETGFLQ